MARTTIAMLNHFPGFRGVAGVCPKMGMGGMVQGIKATMKRKARKKSRQEGARQCSVIAYHNGIQQERLTQEERDEQAFLDIEYMADPNWDYYNDCPKDKYQEMEDALNQDLWNELMDELESDELDHLFGVGN